MQDKASKEENLHDFDERISRHEINCFPENFLVICGDWKDEQVYAQVNEHENHQECPYQCHREFFGQRGES